MNIGLPLSGGPNPTANNPRSPHDKAGRFRATQMVSEIRMESEGLNHFSIVKHLRKWTADLFFEFPWDSDIQGMPDSLFKTERQEEPSVRGLCHQWWLARSTGPLLCEGRQKGLSPFRFISGWTSR